MPKKKKPEQEFEYYKIEVDDWDVGFDFGVNDLLKDFFNVTFLETSRLIFTGKLTPTIKKNINRAVVKIIANEGLDDHRKKEFDEYEGKLIGQIEKPMDEEILIFLCHVPSRLFHNLAAQSGKINFIKIRGSKVRYRKGDIFDVDLSSSAEND